MEQDEINRFMDIEDAYTRSNLINYGSPDQYQYRQNQLCQKLAEFVLTPYWNFQSEDQQKKKQKK